jgi:hypothetical protein
LVVVEGVVPVVVEVVVESVDEESVDGEGVEVVVESVEGLVVSVDLSLEVVVVGALVSTPGKPPRPPKPPSPPRPPIACICPSIRCMV